jgi:hypothetical protein
MATSSNSFYIELQPIGEFQSLTKDTSFHDVPDDWTVIVGDIVGSTQAVAEGQYKTVNMVGASCIAAAVNVYDETAIAYVFGGDGATLLIPPAAVEPVRESLKALQRRTLQSFGLELRIGAVPVADIRGHGARIRIAKLELSPGNHIALFSGGGCALADALVKAPQTSARYLVQGGEEDAEPDLSRLSCRWNKLASQRGMIGALLVQALGRSAKQRNDNFTHALETITATLGDLNERAPANPQSLIFRWPPRGARIEALSKDGTVRFKRICDIWLESFYQWLAHTFSLTIGGYDANAYATEVAQNTDFLRFDDMIRLVLDCSNDEIAALRQALDALEAQSMIRYGLHTAPNALMTCLVFDISSHAHVHFIDGDEGGFTMASRELKAKLKG